MAARRSGYSRWVRTLKFGLPVLALIILAAIVVLTRQIDPGRAIPVAGVDIDQILRDQGIGKPSFVGTTKGGATVRLDARRAVIRDGADDDMEAAEVAAEITLPSGKLVAFTADDVAILTEGAEAVDFSGNVNVTANPDLTIRTEHLLAARDMSRLSAPGPTIADGPMGHVEAGSMELTLGETGDEGSGFVLVFQAGVRLIYTP